MMASATLSSAARRALESLSADLRRIFGTRLQSLCTYGPSPGGDGDVRSIALVDRLDFDDLCACLPLARGWEQRGLAVPLLLEREEFTRTLDVFPLEYGEIIASHIVVEGDDPFDGLSVPDADRRRACELQAKSHLIHLREGFLETGGDPRRVSALIGASAAGFGRLLAHIVELVAPATPTGGEDLPDAAEEHIGIPRELTREVLAATGGGPSTIADPTALLSRYIGAVERVWEFVDGWKRA
jgi:hypothetical protein